MDVLVPCSLALINVGWAKTGLIYIVSRFVHAMVYRFRGAFLFPQKNNTCRLF